MTLDMRITEFEQLRAPEPDEDEHSIAIRVYQDTFADRNKIAQPRCERADQDEDLMFCGLPNPFDRKTKGQKELERAAAVTVKEVQQKVFEAGDPHRQLQHPETEAAFTPWTANALLKDADLYKPVVNKDGSTTFTIVQVGLTDRDLTGNDGGSVKPYARTVEVTVPPGAINFRNCEFKFHNRKLLDEKDYLNMIERDKNRQTELTGSRELAFYTHGILTSAEAADTQALMLELTHGHPVVNVDWQAQPMPVDMDQSGLLEKRRLYENDRATAANSEPHFNALLDKTIEAIGAENTTMIAYSHGAMIDTRYLKHRADDGQPKLHAVILTHPDVPKNAPELVVWHSIFFPSGLLSQSADRSFVIGSTRDKPLKAGSLQDRNSPRLGNNADDTRTFIKWNGAMPVTESPRHDRQDNQHFVNYAAIAQLVHAEKDAAPKELQDKFNSASDKARWRWYKPAIKK